MQNKEEISVQNLAEAIQYRSRTMFVDNECDPNVKASAQGLFMLMTNGLGATIGMLAAGKVISTFCHWDNGFLVGDWRSAWLIFAAFSLIVALAFMILFKYKHNPEETKN